MNIAKQPKSEDSAMLEKIKGIPNEIRAHWKTPAPSKYISYSEFAAYSFGGIGVNTIGSLVGYASLSANCLLIGSAYGIDPTHLGWMNIIMGIINLVKAPFISMLIDNTNTKYGKFRPYLLYTGFPSALLLCLMAFYPNDVAYSTKVILIGVTYALLMVFQSLFSQAFTSLAQVLTPNGEERTSLLSVSMFVYSLGPSIVNMLLPICASFTGGMTNFNTYRILFPIFSIIGLVLSLITFKGTEEKIVVAKDYVAKVKFADGIKQVAQNKYFWIINTHSILGALKYGVGSILGWYCVYQLQNDAMLGVMNTIIGTASVPLMLLAPLLAKKLGKRNVLIVTNIARAFFCMVMIFAMDNTVTFFICLYLATLSLGGESVITNSMTAEIFDYQQWKTGTRLEGFITQLGGMLTTLAGMFSGLIVPYLYKHYGLEKDYTVLYSETVRTPIFNVLIITTIISCLLCIIPVFFYDLKEEKHKEIIEELKLRARE